MWALGLLWAAIGLLWLVPFAASIVEVVCGLCMLALGRYAWWGGAGALAGALASIVCLNPISLALELIAAALAAIASLALWQR